MPVKVKMRRVRRTVENSKEIRVTDVRRPHRKKKARRPHRKKKALLLLILIAGLLFSAIVFALHFSFSSLDSFEGWLQRENNNVIEVPLRRFPLYGTKQFAEQCQWSIRDKLYTNLTILVTPMPGGGEGMADWICTVVAAYIIAVQTGCRLLLDYGNGTDIQQVVVPLLRSDDTNQVNDWTVPTDLECQKHLTPKKDSCVQLTTTSQQGVVLEDMQRYLGGRGGRKFVAAPKFRWLYRNLTAYKTKFQDLEKALPDGFQIETAMACGIGNLFQLSHGATAFESGLFSKLLPTLRNEKNLVISVYIRTGLTDERARVDEGKGFIKATPLGADAAMTASCAANVEQKYLSGIAEDDFEFDRIVWLVISDSVAVKSWAIEQYDSLDANVNVDPKVQKWKSKVIPREVLVTGTHGVHTRMRRGVSTADFAEAFIDWYLLGESDVVVTSFSFYSFGMTASQRTARIVYEAKACTRLV